MKKVLILLATLGLVACGENEGIVFTKGQTCTVEGNTITCPDGSTTTLINGVDGKDGTDGVNGSDGAKGDKGDKGDTGATGATGAKGDKGDKGDRGATGATGPKGDKGDTGKKGEKGDKGDTGANGADGKDGKDGKDGADGVDAVIFSETKMPVAGVCHNIAPGIWSKNEGIKADVYDNSSCSHEGPVGTYTDAGAICNNISAYNEHNQDHSGEICWVDNYQISIEGSYATMIIKVLEFNK